MVSDRKILATYKAIKRGTVNLRLLDSIDDGLRPHRNWEQVLRYYAEIYRQAKSSEMKEDTLSQSQRMTRRRIQTLREMLKTISSLGQQAKGYRPLDQMLRNTEAKARETIKVLSRYIKVADVFLSDDYDKMKKFSLKTELNNVYYAIELLASHVEALEKESYKQRRQAR